jgi:hypothetical protein
MATEGYLTVYRDLGELSSHCEELLGWGCWVGDRKLSFFLDFGRAFINPTFALTACKVCLVVGSLLFAINHGAALIAGEMTTQRWISAVMTYGVPYCVSVYSQLANQQRQQDNNLLVVLSDGDIAYREAGGSAPLTPRSTIRGVSGAEPPSSVVSLTQPAKIDEITADTN